MIRVVIVAHHEHTEARQLADATATWLRDRGHECWMPTGDAADGDPADADLVLSLGGDGTMLRAVGLLDGAPVPLLGVNLGRLGYLTEIEPDQVETALERFVAGSIAGQWHLDQRMMLAVTVIDLDGAIRGSWRALNEAVVEKRESGHTVNLLVRIDGEPFTSYAADGLIVSTPTGSTAYSLSARGPVVSPKHRALLVTPVAPHMLFDRSLVLDPSETVEIEVLAGWEASVAIDGRSVCALVASMRVRCVPSPETASFVRFGAHHYHQVLKAKFGLLDR
ncbi:MAG TPA: NAD(+)/NADH kinase [Acidimicrobiia bacterium]|nr:NAD(+)/NADH kinase [Acidimicrobiia bacterium]